MPQAFSNIARPGYRSGPPATVQQKELVKIEDMARENNSIANFLSTFGMANESCLNNLRVSRDQQVKLFDQFRATQDGPTREQIMLQLHQITQREASQMEFMLPHAHPNLDASRLCNLHSATISGDDLFDRTPMQEYEQHLIRLGVKPGSKKDCFHPYKKHKKGSVSSLRMSFTNQYWHPNTWCNSPFSLSLTRVVAEESEPVAGDAAMGVTQQ